MFELIVALLSVLMIAVSQLLFRSAALEKRDASVRGLFLRYASHPKIILGLTLNVGAAVCWIISLRKLEISYLYPLLSLNYLLVPLGAWRVFGEKISHQRLAAIALIGIGVFLCLLSK